MVDKGDPLTVSNSTATAVVENAAQGRLSTASAYAITFERITMHYADGILTLRGELPSFYLKQVLQTLLRDVEGVARIRNLVDVEVPRRRQVKAFDREPARFSVGFPGNTTAVPGVRREVGVER